jgi:hypothetical protein
MDRAFSYYFNYIFYQIYILSSGIEAYLNEVQNIHQATVSALIPTKGAAESPE